MEKLSLLCQSPLFEMLRDQELVFVANLASVRECKAGDVVFEEGEVGDSLYILTQGEVEVSQRRPDGKGEVSLATLAAFQFFGEMGVLEKTSRSATVRTKTDVKLLCLSAEDLTTFRGAFPDGYLFLVHNLAREVSLRLRRTNERLLATLTAAEPRP